jgi:fatty acid CoA ligase FadD9
MVPLLTNMQLMLQSMERMKKLMQTDAELREATASPSDLAHLRNNCRYSIEYVAEACKIYAPRACLGSRRNHQPYTTQNYAEVWQRIQRLATAWQRSGQVGPNDFVGICGFASPDWVIADLACLYLAAVSVPIRTNIKIDDIVHIINETELVCVVCSAEQLPLLEKALSRCPSVKSIVVIDDPTWQPNGQGSCPSIANIAAIEEYGAGVEPVPYLVPGRDIVEDPLLTIIYTSGSTGHPKGAMFHESIWVHTFSGPINGLFPQAPMIGVGALPLNHAAGLLGFFQFMMNGGVTYFVQKSDMSTLFDDIRLVRPSVLALVPRITELMFQHYQAECIKRGGGVAVEEEVLNSMRHFLGDRLCYVVTSSAPTASEIMDFLKRCLQVPVLNGYGATESGTLTIENRVLGMISAYKLVDLPELGYRTSDTPYPRGEFCVKSARMVRGYYKHPELTAQLYDPEGFIKTGDIVEEQGPGIVVWIDRKNNVLKLAQGEYVSVSHLEVNYVGNSPYIEQIYLYANSSHSYLLAVVVPNKKALMARLAESADNPVVVKQLLRQELDRVAREAQVHSYEVPRDFLIEMQPFAKENGLLTESAKPARIGLQQRYGERLEQLYAQIEANTLDQLRTLSQAKSLSLAERVHKAMSVTLGLADLDVGQSEQSFMLLGGDSLSAARLQSIIEELCGVAPSVGLILDSNTSMRDIIQHVEKLAAGQPSNQSYGTIHGRNTSVVHAEDLRLEAFLGQAAIESANALPLPSGPAKTVLLTGANGFLGRFLLLDLLERVAPHDGQVICVVRAHDHDTALARLRSAYAKSGPELLERFDRLTPPGRLLVLAGDLMQPGLGLGAGEYDALAKRVDTIVHNGALVNHALAYSQLYEPNVLGTVEVMRFAISHQRKAISFISTAAVAAGLSRTVSEQEAAPQLWQSRTAGEGYAVGYATSKWACEVLLQELHKACGIPVNVFRCSMMLGHSRVVGQINAGDFFTRLLFGVIHTGLAPQSFYSSSGPHHFDGLAVDFAAESIASIATQQRNGRHTYHVTNPNKEDGISLDTIIDWVASAGYPIERITPYSHWFQRFSDALRVLPDKERSHSPWLILHQWQHTADSITLDLDATLFRGALRNLTLRSAVPGLNETYVHHLLKSMVQLGMLSSPSASN